MSENAATPVKTARRTLRISRTGLSRASAAGTACPDPAQDAHRPRLTGRLRCAPGRGSGGLVRVRQPSGEWHPSGPGDVPHAGGRSVGAMTVLITSASQPGSSGLIMLMHFDAHDKKGGVVSIPPQTLVQVPGHGLKQIDTAPGFGGPSLLVKTVEQVTHVQIDHYARIEFTGVSNLINVIGGVNVTLPKETVSKESVTHRNKTETKKYTFHAGVNHLNGVTAVYYVRNSSISPDSRVLEQQNLLRAIMDRMTSGHMLTNPLTAVHVVSAVVAMLTVDSNFTNSQVEGFATQLARVGGSGATFMTGRRIPVRVMNIYSPVSDQLWRRSGLTRWRPSPRTIPPR